MTTTPPPRYELRVPHAPRGGPLVDSPVIQPITPKKPVRRQARVNSHRDQTPEPLALTLEQQQRARLYDPLLLTGGGLRTPPSTKRAAKRFRTVFESPPTSTYNSPETKRARAVNFSGLDDEDTSSRVILPPSTTSMLPTPSKTPQKRRSQFLEPPASSSKRLFTIHDDLETETQFPTPKRSPRRSRTSDLAAGLDSFSAEQLTLDIEEVPVYTDMRDTVPEVDLSADNPFYDDPSKPAAIIYPGRAQQEGLANIVPDEFGMTREDIEAGIRDGTGITYSCKGRRIFKHFKDEQSPGPNMPTALSANFGLAHQGSNPHTPAETSDYVAPITRSSIKGRLLFPEAHAKKNQEQFKKFGVLAGGLSYGDIDTHGSSSPEIQVPDSLAGDTPVFGTQVTISEEEADTEIDESGFHASHSTNIPRAGRARKGKGKASKKQENEWDTTDDEEPVTPPRATSAVTPKRSLTSSKPVMSYKDAVSHIPSMPTATPPRTRTRSSRILDAATPSESPLRTSGLSARSRITRQERNAMLRDMEEKQESAFWNSPAGKRTQARLRTAAIEDRSLIPETDIEDTPAGDPSSDEFTSAPSTQAPALPIEEPESPTKRAGRVFVTSAPKMSTREVRLADGRRILSRVPHEFASIAESRTRSSPLPELTSGSSPLTSPSSERKRKAVSEGLAMMPRRLGSNKKARVERGGEGVARAVSEDPIENSSQD